MLRKLHFNFVITLLTLVLCMGVLCNYSKATEFDYEGNFQIDLSFYCPDISWSAVYQKLHNNSYNSNTVVNGARLETDRFIYYFLSYGDTPMFPCVSYDSTQNVIDFCNSSFEVPYYAISTTYRSESNRLANYCAIIDKSASGFVLMYCSVDGEISYNYNTRNITDGTIGNIYFYYFSYQYATGTWFRVNDNSINGELDLDDIINYECSSNFYFCNTSSYLYYITAGSYSQYVEDDRLSIYSLESNNGKLLNIDVSQFRSGYSAATTKVFSDIDITLDCDGSEVQYTLGNNNSNIIDIWSAFNNVHTVQILYSFFDLDSYDDVFIKYVSFSLTTSSAGGSSTEDFNISCRYYLKKIHESIEPVIVPDPEYNNTEIYNTSQINNIKQDLHEYSSRFSFLSGTWNFVLEQDLPEFPGWATVYQNYVWFADGNSDTTYRGHWFQMANNIPSLADLTRPFDPSEFLEQNKTFAFYDVILLKVFTVEVLSGSSVIDTYDLAGYLVFISDRYYDHYNARLNLDILTQLQLSAENSVMFFDAAKARLDGIAADLDTGFNGFLDVGTGTQYKIISWLQTINDNMSGSFVSLSNTLSDGFSSVVVAINNITPGGSSYSLPALSDALSFLFTPTLEWSAINYDDYEDSLGVLALPFQFTFDVLDIAQNQYDPHFKLHLNELSLDVPLEAGEDPDMTNFTVIEDQDIEQDPLDVIPSGLWTTLQYLNAFGLVMVQALSTYNHIFRR